MQACLQETQEQCFWKRPTGYRHEHKHRHGHCVCVCVRVCVHVCVFVFCVWGREAVRAHQSVMFGMLIEEERIVHLLGLLGTRPTNASSSSSPHLAHCPESTNVQRIPTGCFEFAQRAYCSAGNHQRRQQQRP